MHPAFVRRKRCCSVSANGKAAQLGTEIGYPVLGFLTAAKGQHHKLFAAKHEGLSIAPLVVEIAKVMFDIDPPAADNLGYKFFVLIA